MQKNDNKIQATKIIESKNNLMKFKKLERTLYREYQILKELLNTLQHIQQTQQQSINKQSQQLSQIFLQFYGSLTPQVKKLPLYQFLNYAIWNNEALQISVRQKTKFFQIVSNWIVAYEMQFGKIKGSICEQIKFIHNFFEKQTNTIFQSVVLFAEIFDDLFDMLEPVFWVIKFEDQETKQQMQNQENCEETKNNQYIITKQDVLATVKFLSTQVFYHTIFIDGSTPFMNSIMSQILPFSQKYKQFILNALQFVLQSVKINKNQQSRSLLQKPEQNQLTTIALTFLQRPDLTSQQIIKVVKGLMLHTDKAVRFAMVIEYVKFYDYLEKIGNDQVLQALEQMLYFRELIIGRVQVGEAGLLTHILGAPLVNVDVARAAKERIYFSQEKQYGIYSILQIEVIIEKDDITLIMWKIEDGKEQQFWKEEKTSDRRIDIMLKEPGLYALQFNNIYSWIKPKHISYKVGQYGCYQ